ncbi:MAG: 3-phosphoshikimate 1-carboxyvinyltransferase [Candidatus Omnitrophota bacterium]
MKWTIGKAERGLRGEIAPPPDKSISHRAVMFGSISRGKTRIKNFLFAEDCMRTFAAFKLMGVDIERKGDSVFITGNGLRGLDLPDKDFYLGNSGTTMRIISGILAGQNFTSVLTGDESLSIRPMERIIKPLSLMGADIEAVDGHAPLTIRGKGVFLIPIKYTLPVASAQVKSCILAAGLYSEGKTTVIEPYQSRDHTERMLEYFSAEIQRNGLISEVKGVKELNSGDIDVPGDISGAAFFIVAALLVKGSLLVIRNVGINPTRTGLIDVLKRMGAKIRILDMSERIEPAADLEIKYSELKSTVIEEKEIPLLIDEIPVLIIAALMAEGRTVIKGIKELKVKETDRIKTMKHNLCRMGLDIAEENETLIIEGNSRKIKAAELESFGDHRIAMSMAVAALISDGECVIKNTDCTETSYPGFLGDLKKVRSF